MSDLRLPGLNTPVGPAARGDAGGARDGAPASGFDDALLRSVQGAAPSTRGAERVADRGSDRAADAALARRREDDAAARSPRPEERVARAPSRPAERAPERKRDAAADRSGNDAARSEAPAVPARPEAGSARGDAAPAASMPDDAERAAPAAERSDTVAAALMAAAPTAAPGTAPALVPAIAQPAAPLAASAADDAAEDVPSDAAADALTSPAPAAAPDARAAVAAPLQAAGKTAPAEATGRDEAVRAPVRDRLTEDFERRYENALGRAAGAAGHTTLTGAAPLPGAGLPPGQAPTAPSLTVAYASVSTPIGHPAFGQDLSHRILLFAGQHVQSAEIAVTPADLGPIRVAIEVRGQEAAMQFSAAHATTRAAIEDALPRLREMLAAQGLQLTQADVGDRSQRGAAFGQRGDGRTQADPGEARGRAAVRPGALGAGGSEAANVRRIGLIDIRV